MTLQCTAKSSARSRESPGHYAHPEKSGTGFLLSDLDEADRWVKACPPEANGVKELEDPFTYVVPHGCDRVVADRSSLLRHALSVGAGRPRPGGPCVKDGDGVGGEAIVVGVGFIRGVHHDVLREIEVDNGGGGGTRTKLVTVRRVRLGCIIAVTSSSPLHMNDLWFESRRNRQLGGFSGRVALLVPQYSRSLILTYRGFPQASRSPLSPRSSPAVLRGWGPVLVV